MRCQIRLLFFRNIMDPMKMFDDWTTSTNDIYDFDLLTSEQKNIFIKKMFDGERLYVEIMFNGPLGEFFYNLRTFTEIKEMIWRII